VSLFNIIVDIAANTAKFEASISRVENSLKSLGETAEKAFQFAGASAGIIEIVSAFDGFVESAGKLEHASQEVGTTVEQLSRLQFAAVESGVSSEELTQKLDIFARTAEKAAAGSTQQAAAFDAIGVSVTDANGQMKSMNELLLEVADKFASYRDSAEKTALAQQLFGRSGAELIPLLNKGAEGIRELNARSDELGNTISSKTARAAEEFNSKLGELHATATAFWNQMASDYLPGLTKIADLFTSMANATEKATAKIEAFKIVFGTLASPLSVASDAFFANAKATSDWKDSITDDWNKVADAAKTNAPIVTTAIDDADAAYQKLQDSVDKNLTDENFRIMAENFRTLARTADEGLSKIPRIGKTAWDDLDEIGQQGAKNMEAVFENFFFNPTQVGFHGLVSGFAQALERMAAQALASDLFRALGFGDKQGSTGGLGGFFTSVLGWLGFGKHGTGSSGASVPAGSVSIEAADPVYDDNFMGFATGGSFTVGGSGGTDSQLVQFKATPGEHVSVGQHPALSFSPTYQINAQGADPSVLPQLQQMIGEAQAQTKRDILVAFNRSGLRTPPYA
jgi:hypothetical protein